MQPTTYEGGCGGFQVGCFHLAPRYFIVHFLFQVGASISLEAVVTNMDPTRYLNETKEKRRASEYMTIGTIPAPYGPKASISSRKL